MSDGRDGEDEFVDAGQGQNDPAANRWLVRCYRTALADYRLDRGHFMAPVVAMLVESAVFLTNPGGVQCCGMDAQCAEEYDTMNAHIWQRLCTVIADDEVEVLEPVVANIVGEEYEREFATPVDRAAAAFATIIEAEFAVGLPISPAEGVEKASSLIWERLRGVSTFHA